MHKGRLEAFSDAVIAIIMTIMVLELRPPEGFSWAAILPLWPKLLFYALSFLMLGIYWNNHHHMLQKVSRVSGPVLWANHHLLFWLSLIPFATAWMGEKFSTPSVFAFNFVLLACAISYTILSNYLIKLEGSDSEFAQAIGRDYKGKVSLALYTSGPILSFFAPVLSCIAAALVAVIWFIPDRRLEKPHPAK